jgi:hypothetical protein
MTGKNFIGDYSAECRFFKNRNLLLGNGYLMATIEANGIKGMYFYRRLLQESKGKKRYRYVEASPDLSPRGGKGFFSSIEKGRVRIPKEAVQYANLRKDNVSVIGIANHLNIWDSDKLDEVTKDPLTDKELAKVARLFRGG